MVETVTLRPHDPLPDPPAIVVMRRFDEDDPRRLMVEVIVSRASGAEDTSRPQRDDGGFMDLDEAVAAASEQARSQGLARVYVVDRTAGPRESDILTHHGDHSINSGTLADMDLEDGEKGPDMRDLR